MFKEYLGKHTYIQYIHTQQNHMVMYQLLLIFRWNIKINNIYFLLCIYLNHSFNCDLQ